MSTKLTTIAVFWGLLATLNLRAAMPDSTVCIDPVISQLDSMSYSLFTRDKFFVTDAEVLASINTPPELLPRYTDAEIREKMKMIPAEFQLTYNSYVRDFIDMFAYKRRGLMTRCLSNAQIYFPVFEEVLDRKGLPIELKYLPIVESAFNPIAVSKAGATGLWQIMYGTGTMLGLEVNTYIDERRDPHKSTEAAAEYLKKLYRMYGDWQLVLAAYNSGPGNVNKAIARAGGNQNFWAIMNYLPAETRSYVPTYIAAVYVMHYYKDFKLVPSEPKRELYAVDTVTISAKVSLRHISNILGIAVDELQFLNPSIKKGIIPYTEKGFPLNLPISYFAQFEARKEEIMNDTSLQLQNSELIIAAAPKLIYYKVRKNETLAQIAARYKVTTTSLKKWNGLKNSYVYYGQKLKIYTQPTESVTSPQYAQAFAPKLIEKTSPAVATTKTDTLNDSTSLQTNKELRAGDTQQADSVTQAKNTTIVTDPQYDAKCGCIYHVVQPGDTLWSISQRYEGLTIDKLKASNKAVSDRPIRVGDILKIFLN